MPGLSDSNFKATSGFSLAGSLIGGTPNGNSSGRNKKGASDRLREGLHLGSERTSPVSKSNNAVSSPDRSYTKQRSSHRRVASYRQNTAPKSPARSPKRLFPLSLSPSSDSSDKHSERSSSKGGDFIPTMTAKNKSFEDYFTTTSPKYKDAFTVLSEGKGRYAHPKNEKSPYSPQEKKQAGGVTSNYKSKASEEVVIDGTIDNSPHKKQPPKNSIEPPQLRQQLKRRTESPLLFGIKSKSVSPPNTPTESPSPASSRRSRSPSPAKITKSTTATKARAASPMRAPSPLRSIKSKLAKSKDANSLKKSGKHAASIALGEDNSANTVSVSDRSKANQPTSDSPTKTITSVGSPRKGRQRTRSPSPLHFLRPNGSKSALDNGSYQNLDNSERGRSMKGTPSFRSMSPIRLKDNLKSKLTSASPKRSRPQQENLPQKILPLHQGGLDGIRNKHSFDDSVDEISLTLGRTTLSFDVMDDNESAAQKEEEEDPNDINVGDGCIINTTTFNVFTRREFLRAMGGAGPSLLTKNYIHQGDVLCKQGNEQLDQAVQMYYAGLGTILSRIRDWSIEQLREERDASVANGENDVPPLPVASSLSYRDFVTTANCADTNILLLIISSILLRSGNAHFCLKNFETACRDYASAQYYQMIRTKAMSKHNMNESLVMEDAKLNGRVRNNMASALFKRKLYEEARSEYTKALQIKQSTLEVLHKRTRQNGDSVKDVNDKNMISDIASTFHNIGLLRLSCNEASKAEKAFKQSLSLRVKKFGLDDLRVSSTLNALGGLYYKAKRYDDAFRSYKESLRIWKVNGGKADLQTAEYYYNIGLVFNAKGPYSKAKVSITECVKIRRQLCGNLSLPVAEALYISGMISLSIGNFKDALDKSQEVLAIRQRLLGKEHLLVSNARVLLGKIHIEMGEYDKAMCSYSVALAIRTNHLGKHHPLVAEVLHAIGAAYIEAEEYSKSIETLQEALRLQRNVLGPSLEAAETLKTLSLVFFRSGDTEKAIEVGEESLLMLKSSVGFDHILVAHVLKHTGDCYQDIETYDNAMEAYGESLRIMAAWLGREHILLSKTLSEVGVVRFKTGEYTIAKQSFTEALRIMRLPENNTDKSSIYPTLSHLGHALYKNKELEVAKQTYLESLNIQASIIVGEENRGLEELSDNISSIENKVLTLEQSGGDTSELSSALGGIANTLRYIGLVNQELGEFERALHVNKLSLSVRLLQPFKEYPAIALMAETIAMFEFKLQNFANALDYFNQALEAKKEFQGDVTIDVARTVNNLANIHFSLGNLDKAMELYQEALGIKKSCLGEDSEDVVNTLKNIAQVMVSAGREQDALQTYQSIIDIRQGRYGMNHETLAETFSCMGDVHIKLGDLEKAMTCFEQTIKIQKMNDGTCDERIMENLGSIYGKLGQWQKAESTFKEILQVKRAEHGEDFVGLAGTLDLLAVSFIEQDRSIESIEHLEEALRIRKTCLGEADDEILASYNKLAYVYKSLGMEDEVKQVKAALEAIKVGVDV